MNLKYSGSYLLGTKKVTMNLWELKEDSNHLMAFHEEKRFMIKHPCWTKYFKDINEARDFLYWSVNNKGEK